MPIHRLALIMTIATFLVGTGATVLSNPGVTLMTDYFELLDSENYESAEFLWTESSRQRANRFGIRYEGIALKTDASSPFMQLRDEFRGKAFSPVSLLDGKKRGFATLRHSAKVEGKSVQHTYDVFHDGEHVWFTFAQDRLLAGMERRDTKYLQVQYHPSRAGDLTAYACAAADRCVEQAASRMGIPDSTLAFLQKEKLSYILVESDSVMRELAGQDTKGYFDVESDDIISSEFPHYHEIVHFLTALHLRELPLFTLPIFHEGIATYLGGRWGKEPDALLALGAFMYRENVVPVDSLFSRSGFTPDGADIHYPIAGMLTAYLLDRLGSDAYWVLYRKFSGKARSLDSLGADQVKSILVSVLKKQSWDDVHADFLQFSEQYRENSAVLCPGGNRGSKKSYSHELITLWQDKEWIVVDAAVDSNPASTRSLLFGIDPALASRVPSLFEVHFPEGPGYTGHRFGIRWDRNEIGVYNYGTNQIVGKHIDVLWPAAGYFDAKEGRIRARIRRDVFENVLPTTKDAVVLY